MADSMKDIIMMVEGMSMYQLIMMIVYVAGDTEMKEGVGYRIIVVVTGIRIMMAAGVMTIGEMQRNE